LAWINEFSQNGGDFKNLIEDILNKLHLQILIKNNILTSEDKKITLTLSETSLLMKLMIEAYQNLRNTPIDSLPVEIALIEFYNKVGEKNNKSEIPSSK
jgi:DNA polymerase-3 subunit gamma/tau